MTDEPSQHEKDAAMSTDELILDYVEGIIAVDDEARKPENIDPYFRHLDPDMVGGIEFWQLQQSVSELGMYLQDRDDDLDKIEARWKDHKEWWARYLVAACVKYARGEGDDEEFAMDFYMVFLDENPRGELE